MPDGIIGQRRWRPAPARGLALTPAGEFSASASGEHPSSRYTSFTPRERELIRREFCRRFGQDPSVADGIFLRTWHSGPLKGQPKIPRAVQGLLDRGLVEVGPGRYGPRARFTKAGLRELRLLLEDRRAIDPERFVALTNSRSRLVYRPLPEDDPLQRCPDIALAKRLLDWRPTTSLDDGLARTIAYFDRLLRGRGDRARQPEPTRALPLSR